MAFTCFWSALAGAADSNHPFDRPVMHPAIPLLDQNGRHVLDSGNPMSTKASCGNGAGGGCHDYAKIAGAYHFEQGRDESKDSFGALRGLPQLTSPGYFGGYNCMGANNPGWLARKVNRKSVEFSDYGSADLVRECGECHAGGGWAETDRQGQAYEARSAAAKPFDGDYFSRRGDAVTPWDWRKSGVKEADCLLCHVDFSALRKFPESRLGGEGDGSDSPVQHLRRLRDDKFTRGGFFRYADSAALEFLDLKPELPGGLALLTVERQPVAGTAQPDYALALNAAGQPRLRWNPAAFDASRKARMPMLRFPGNDNCMYCHYTSVERRGFHGFGEAARVNRAADGTALADPRDDIHKGLRWTEDNGETRSIENCNGCHAKQFYKFGFENVDLDADHNFPKGNGDNDVRNDLDNLPPPKSCEHCHDQAANPALPSGEKTVLAAHRQIWIFNGDMAGYPAESLTAITQAHLDTLACQTCHIKDLSAAGRPLTMRFRYRVGHDDALKIFPYKPAYRYYARDRNSGRVLNRHERLAILEARDRPDGSRYGAIVDPVSRQPVGDVPMAGGEFGEPTSYAGYVAMKRGYDRLLKSKGYRNPDVRFVYVESNDYVISHNTRAALDARQCAECHDRDASGAFDKIVADRGLLGSANIAEVARLPDRRLVDEGVFELGMPYYRIEADGRIVDNVADILYFSRLDPSMTLLKSETATTVAAPFKAMTAAEAVATARVAEAQRAGLASVLGSRDALLFSSRQGASPLKSFAMIQAGGRLAAEALRGQVSVSDIDFASRRRILAKQPGRVVGSSLRVELTDPAGKAVRLSGDRPALLKLPYRGSAETIQGVRILFSSNGKSWRALPAARVLAFQPRAALQEGYVVVRTARLQGRFVAVDLAVSRNSAKRAAAG